MLHGACYQIILILAAPFLLNLIKESNHFWSQIPTTWQPHTSYRNSTHYYCDHHRYYHNNPVTIITIIRQSLHYIKPVLPIMLRAITYCLHSLLIAITCAIYFIFKSVLGSQTALSLLEQANTLLHDGYNMIHESESFSQIAAATQINAINLMRVIFEHPGTSSILVVGYYL